MHKILFLLLKRSLGELIVRWQWMRIVEDLLLRLAGLALDIAQVSTSDTRKTRSIYEKELTQSHVRYQVIYFSHFLQLSPSLRVLIASTVAVTFAALHW